MKESVYLCSCKNCGSILIDTNPILDAKKTELGLAVIMTLDTLTDFEEDGQYFSNGCPNCNTDAYLSDDYTDCLEYLDNLIETK